MLPSAGGRITTVIGIAAGFFALYLANWGIPGLPDYVWKASSVLAVCCLLLRRQFPNETFDDKALRFRVGDRSVDRLNALQNLAMILIGVGLILAIALAPFVSKPYRHEFALAAFGAFLAAVAIYAYVGMKYRALLVSAGMYRAASSPT